MGNEPLLSPHERALQILAELENRFDKAVLVLKEKQGLYEMEKAKTRLKLKKQCADDKVKATVSDLDAMVLLAHEKEPFKSIYVDFSKQEAIVAVLRTQKEQAKRNFWESK